MGGNGLKLCQGRVRLDLTLFLQRVVMQWHSCPGSGRGVTIPGGVQNHGDVALRDVGQWARWGGLGLGILEVFSNLNDPEILRSAAAIIAFHEYLEMQLGVASCGTESSSHAVLLKQWELSSCPVFHSP